MPVKIHPLPNEVPEAIPFPEDTIHTAYNGEHVRALWRALLQANRVFTRFRAGFLGKASPVHFFWGSFDLAVTRFSGRLAPLHPGVPGVPDIITREAYSHEVSSAGFWPGGNGMDAAFYAYAYPEPVGFGAARVRPQTAFYSETMREFFLPYEAVRTAPSPERALLEFLQTTYEAAANLAKWDRAVLERRAE
jgi:hypothetical protein